MVRRSYLDVPSVPVLPPAWRRPPEGAEVTGGLTPAAEALLTRQPEARRARAEAKSLSPPCIEDVERRLAAKRAVEEALARGRVKTRAEIRWATDLTRPRFCRYLVRWPAPRRWWRGPGGAIALGALAVFAAFFFYVAVVAICLG